MLEKIVVEGDFEGLLLVMEYLQKIKDREHQTNEMFQPLKDIIEMLKHYDVEFEDNIYSKV